MKYILDMITYYIYLKIVITKCNYWCWNKTKTLVVMDMKLWDCCDGVLWPYLRYMMLKYKKMCVALSTSSNPRPSTCIERIVDWFEVLVTITAILHSWCVCVGACLNLIYVQCVKLFSYVRGSCCTHISLLLLLLSLYTLLTKYGFGHTHIVWASRQITDVYCNAQSTMTGIPLYQGKSIYWNAHKWESWV